MAELPEVLHAVWLSAHPGAAQQTVDAERRLLTRASTQAAFGQVREPQSMLVLGDGPPSTPDCLATQRSGVFRRRVFERSPLASSWSPADGDGRYLLAVQLFVPDPEQQDDCRRWLDDEHTGRQLAVTGTRWYAGYESVDGDFNFLNLWGLDAPDILETPEWAVARDTPWRMRLVDSAIARTERALFDAVPTEEVAT